MDPEKIFAGTVPRNSQRGGFGSPIRHGGGVRILAQLSFATSSSSQLRKSWPPLGPFPHLLWGQGLSFGLLTGCEGRDGGGSGCRGEQEEEVWGRKARGPSFAALILLYGAGYFMHFVSHAV